jgi:hypothetical protein
MYTNVHQCTPVYTNVHPSIHDKHHSLEWAAQTVVSLSIMQAFVEGP